MRVPERLEPLLDYGVIEEVLRPLQSGKEAEVYLVLAEGEERVAKVYKNAQFRSFQQRVQYTEGRRVRSSREQRAMDKRSRHGKAKTEEAWQSAEVDAIHLLRGAGVRVPEPHLFVEGVLVMELVRGEDGQPAPRLVDTHFSPEQATEIFQILVREVVKMLCVGVIHADLSDFNVLISADGPVIIDFPQAVDPARNQSAKKLLLRDVKNLSSFLGRFAPELRRTQYGPEMWDLYERSELYPDTELTGRYEPKKKKAEVSSLLAEIMEIEQEARERREALGLPPPRPARRPVVFVEVEEPPPKPNPKPGATRRGRKRGPAPADPRGPRSSGEPVSPGTVAAKPDGATSDKPKRRRRRRGKRPGGGTEQRPGGNESSAAPGGPAPSPTQATTPAPSGDGAPTPTRRRRRRRRRGAGGPPSGDSGPSKS